MVPDQTGRGHGRPPVPQEARRAAGRIERPLDGARARVPEREGRPRRRRVCYRSVAKRWPRRYSLVVILLRKVLKVLIPRNEA